MEGLKTKSVRVTLPGSRKRLPGSVRALLAADVATAFGVGLTQPYVVLLLHDVRGVPLATATAIVALAALASLVGNPAAGTLIDRFGARAVMVGGVLSALLGALILALSTGALPGAAGVALTGFGWSMAMPALATRIATLVPGEHQSRAYTFQYVLFNAGLGVGAALAGLTVATRPALPMLWLAAAATCALSAVIAAAVRVDPAPAAPASGERPPGYREVLKDRVLRRLLLAAALLSTAGYGVFEAAPSVLALRAHDPAALSWLTVANCLVVVLGLPLGLRVGARWSPGTALVVTGALWATAWAICVPAAYGVGPSVRMVLALAAALIGAGELLLSGALPTLVNALAPDELRGRYNALSSLALTVGMATGPLLTAVATGLGAVAYVLLIAVGAAALATFLVPAPTKEEP